MVSHEWEWKPPKRWRSWRVCPQCGNRATKILSLNTGLYRCQICDCEYDDPKIETRERRT